MPVSRHKSVWYSNSACSTPWDTSGWYGVYAVTNSERMPTARTTDGMSWSYAPPPAKQTRRSAEPSLTRPSLPISPSTSASASPSARSSPPASRNAAGIDSNSSSSDDRPTNSNISAISVSVCGTNDGMITGPPCGRRREERRPSREAGGRGPRSRPRLLQGHSAAGRPARSPARASAKSCRS